MQLSWTLRNMSYKRKLIILSVAISILPVLLVGLISSNIAARSIQEQVDTNHQLLLQQIEYRMKLLVENLNIHSISIATSAIVEKSLVELGPPEKLDVTQSMELIESLRKQVNYSPIRYSVSLIYKKFDYIYNNSQVSIPYTDSIFHHILQVTRTYRNSPFIISPDIYNNQELMFFRPVPLQSFYSDGIVVLRVEIKELEKILDESIIGIDDRSSILVVDKEGRIIVGSSKGDIGSKLTSSTDLYRFWQNPTESVNALRFNGIDYRLTVQKFANLDWTVIAMMPEKVMQEESNRIRVITWGIVGILSAIWLMVSLGSAKFLYLPIDRVLKVIQSEYKGKANQADGNMLLESLVNDMIHDNQSLRGQLKANEPELKENVYRNLIWGNMTEAEIRKRTDHFDLSLRGSKFRILLITVDNPTHLFEYYRGNDQSLIYYILRKMSEEICELKYACLSLSMQAGQVVVILNSTDETVDFDPVLLETAAEIRESIHKYCKFTVSVTISGSFNDYSGIIKAYRNAQELSRYRLILGPNATIAEHMVEPKVEQYIREIVLLQKNTLSELISGNLEGAKRQLHLLTDQIDKYVNNPETIISYYSHILVEIDIFMNEMGCDIHDIFEENIYQKLHHFDTLVSVKDWFVEILLPEVILQLSNIRISKQERAIQHILQQVGSEYDADLQDISRKYDISVPHLSRLFKEKTGEHFSDYLIQIRMNKAKEWLISSNMPIKEIACKLHYSTVQNFNRTFKQFTNVPPGKFRDEHT